MVLNCVLHQTQSPWALGMGRVWSGIDESRPSTTGRYLLTAPLWAIHVGNHSWIRALQKPWRSLVITFGTSLCRYDGREAAAQSVPRKSSIVCCPADQTAIWPLMGPSCVALYRINMRALAPPLDRPHPTPPPPQSDIPPIRVMQCKIPTRWSAMSCGCSGFPRLTTAKRIVLNGG